MRRGRIAAIAAMAIVAAAPATAGAAKHRGQRGGGHRGGDGLWKLYDQTLSKATYVDLTRRSARRPTST
jgi:hypothetical protein